jgi:hypothetical protein
MRTTYKVRVTRIQIIVAIFFLASRAHRVLTYISGNIPEPALAQTHDEANRGNCPALCVLANRSTGGERK